MTKGSGKRTKTEVETEKGTEGRKRAEAVEKTRTGTGIETGKEKTASGQERMTGIEIGKGEAQRSPGAVDLGISPGPGTLKM